ncbi:MAG TPA: Rrf2 family transcriptional regulator [Lentimicrobium sp.]|nr:Rrf2 family transcriptional regulator [Lentimicrobium sp.]
MKLTKTAEYALRILSFMAKEPGQLYTAKFLVETLNISDKYLRQLMTSLTKAGLIYSVQGREGGYSFAKSPGKIFLSDIIDSVEGMQKYTGCILGFNHCSDDNPCVMHKVWVNSRKEFIHTFTKMTLDNLDFEGVNKY